MSEKKTIRHMSADGRITERQESDEQRDARDQHEAAAEQEQQQQLLERVTEERDQLREQLKQRHAPAPTPDTILEAMGEIMQALSSGRMTAADAKARLYAYQIALSAIRTIEHTKAARQKEERLRKSQTNTIRRTSATAPTATASPRRRRKTKAQRRRPHPTRTKTKTTKPIRRARK